MTRCLDCSYTIIPVDNPSEILAPHDGVHKYKGFWDVTVCRLVNTCRRFGRIVVPLFSGSNSYYFLDCSIQNISPLAPNDIYIYIYMSYRTANLQTLHFKYFLNKYTYFQHAARSTFLSLQDAVYFIMLSFLVL